MELQGKIAQKFPLISGTKKNGDQWQKAAIILETTANNYPRKVYVSAFKEAEAFDQLPLNAEVTLKIDIESREFNGKWYTSVTCYGFELSPSAPTDENGQEMTNEQINENLAKMYGAEPQAQSQVQVQPQQSEDLPF